MIQEMVAILQEDLPYLVLTEDPYLRGLQHRRARQRRARCARRRPATCFCQQVSYEPLLTLEPGGALGDGGRPRGVPGGVAAIGAVIVAIAAFLFGRARGRREAEPLELRGSEAAMAR